MNYKLIIQHSITTTEMLLVISNKTIALPKWLHIILLSTYFLISILNFTHKAKTFKSKMILIAELVFVITVLLFVFA